MFLLGTTYSTEASGDLPPTVPDLPRHPQLESIRRSITLLKYCTIDVLTELMF